MLNMKYGKLTVIKELENHKCLCRCECGNLKTISIYSLRSGNTKSCGCLSKELARERISKVSEHNIKHNKSNTRLFRIWCKLRDRCNNIKNDRYKDYGGRGIKVCDEWLKDFNSFYSWSIANGYKEGLSIDRINVDGNYEPNNCRWVTAKEQANNRRNNHYITYNNVTHTIEEWGNILNIKGKTIQARLSRGWSIERALNYDV